MNLTEPERRELSKIINNDTDFAMFSGMVTRLYVTFIVKGVQKSYDSIIKTSLEIRLRMIELADPKQ